MRRLLTVLVVIAVLMVLYFARALLAPIVVALLLSFLFKPVVRRLQGLRVPLVVSALVIVLGLLVLVSGPMLAVVQYASGWIEDAPQYIAQIEFKLRDIEQTVTGDPNAPGGVEAETEDESDGVGDAVEGADAPAADPAASAADGKAASPDLPAGENGTGMDDDHDLAAEVTKRDAKELSHADEGVAWFTSNMVGPLLGQTQATLVSIAFTLLLLFFLLASGDTFLRRALAVMPSFQDKRNLVELIFEIEGSISAYLLTLTMINVVFGAVAAGLFALTGVTHPIMWGIGAAVCNFVPYVGPIVFWLIFTPMCILTFDTLSGAAVPSAIFVAMNIIEGYVISPHIYGRRLALHPLVVFLGIVIFSWLWGIAGSLMAVPLLVSVNIICRHVESLHAVSGLLSGEGEPLQVGTQPASADHP